MANEKRLIDANELAVTYCDIDAKYNEEPWMLSDILAFLNESPTVDAVILPCSVGDTVYGQFGHYGKKIHECKVIKSKVCQFRDRTLHYFLDV